VGTLCFRQEYFAQACFLSQRVIEKSLKAFLICKSGSYPRQHKVVKLAALYREIEADLGALLDPLKDELKLIDEFYIPIAAFGRNQVKNRIPGPN